MKKYTIKQINYLKSLFSPKIIERNKNLIGREQKDPREVFSEIFEKNLWGNAESFSGPGSSISATANLRKELPVLFKNYNIKTILDLPCGDFNWMKEIDLSNFKYHGADIVKEIIESNKRRFPSLEFSVINLLEDEIPTVDLIICRDCLFHLSFQEIKQALSNIRKSQSKYLLTTSHTWKTFPSKDTERGEFRKLNLQMKPISLPFPIDFIVEGNEEENQEDRCMLLWRCNDLIY
jgi:hypothetical protein